MNKAIAITGFNRPKYMKETLDHLSKNDLSGFSKLYANLEPRNPEVLKEVQSFKSIPIDIIVNKSNLGGRRNAFNVIERAFNDGNDYLFYIEDDVIVSPDATRLINWFFESGKCEEHMALCLHSMNHDPSVNPEIVLSNSPSFTLLGVAFTKEMWKQYMSAAWFDPKFPVPCGTMNNVLKVNRLSTCFPILSRSKHIGREKGVHYRPAKHDAKYMKVVKNEEDIFFDYFCVDRIEYGKGKRD